MRIEFAGGPLDGECEWVETVAKYRLRLHPEQSQTLVRYVRDGVIERNANTKEPIAWRYAFLCEEPA